MHTIHMTDSLVGKLAATSSAFVMFSASQMFSRATESRGVKGNFNKRDMLSTATEQGISP